MHVGLITGLGPAASVVYYQRLTQVAADRDTRLDLTMVEANIREVLANNCGRSHTGTGRDLRHPAAPAEGRRR